MDKIVPNVEVKESVFQMVEIKLNLRNIGHLPQNICGFGDFVTSVKRTTSFQS